MSIFGAIGSEWIKFRRTFTRKLVVLAPVGMVGLYSLAALLGQWNGWSLFLNNLYNWWPLLMIPMGAALLAALAASCETQAGAWRTPDRKQG